MRVIHYTREYQPYFEQLNRAWVEKYFQMEPMDEAVLCNPEDAVIKKGGRIYFAELQSQIIGTVALIFIRDGVYELAKMAVREDFQGRGAGKFLCNTAIEEAKKLGAVKLVLFTNSKLKPAIAIYHKSGFKEVQLDGQEYRRADTKMELVLKSPPAVNWFDRKFDFGSDAGQFHNLLSRLQDFPVRLEETVNAIPEELLTVRTEHKWSVNENVGHLCLLERLWRNRFREIQNGSLQLLPADLNNTATDQSRFNEFSGEELLKGFGYERAETVGFLEQMGSNDLLKHSIHPRLNQSMSVTDLMYFVAEHDEHHLNAIRRIIQRNNTRF